MIQHDEEARRFTLEREGLVSYLAYRLLDDTTVDFRSTWVHPAHRGHGIGARLVEHGLLWAEAEGVRVVPTCWFVAEFIDRNDRFRPLLATS